MHLFQNTITPLSFAEKTALQSFHHPLTNCVIHAFLWSPARRALTHSPSVCMQTFTERLSDRAELSFWFSGAHKHPDPVEEVQFVQFVYGVNVIQPQSDPNFQVHSASLT